MAMAVGEEAADETTAGDSPGTIHGPKLRAFSAKKVGFLSRKREQKTKKVQTFHRDNAYS